MIEITHTERGSAAAGMCNRAITTNHYLHKMPDPRTSYEIYSIWIEGYRGGYLVFGRPQATRCKDWYASVDDVISGRCEVTRWQVLNLARVWIDPRFQVGGKFYEPALVPGFTDRRGVWHSSLASTAILAWMAGWAQGYLVYRPPVFLDEPYELRWLMSYCDTKIHRGVIYKAAGFKLYSTNAAGIQTWRIPLPRMTRVQDQEIQHASKIDQRAAQFRAKRDQGQLFQEVP